MTQFAFTKASANIVVPCFTSISIVIAVLGSYISLNEIIILRPIVEIIEIIFGVILLTNYTSKYK